MQIKKNTVVTFHYSLREEGGPELENNYDTVPMAYLHGYRNILAGLEDAMDGLEEGDTKEVTLPPPKAYGDRREGAVQKVPIKHLIGKYKRLLPGTIVKVSTEQGAKNACVIKAGKFMVTLDTNHPFAGKTLIFNIEIKSVREASAEEVSHRHAHGVGGHQH